MYRREPSAGQSAENRAYVPVRVKRRNHAPIIGVGGDLGETRREVIDDPVWGDHHAAGAREVISDHERCCGHDALWCGDHNTFRKLAEWNLAVIKSSGAKTVLFSCPEGYVTFKNHYAKHFGELPFEVLHMTDFLARELPGSGLSFKTSSSQAVTYHDPCRLGRLAGIYEQPRQLLQLVPDTRLVEMERNRDNALCCGTSAWMECSGFSKAIQNERLQEAVQSGAQTLITACPKCQIHFTCAQSGTDSTLEVIDLYTYLSRRLSETESTEGGIEKC
jgi:Fe-S oxidoreductase